MLKWYLTAGHGGLVALSVIVFLLAAYAAHPAGRRDLADKWAVLKTLCLPAFDEIAAEWGPQLQSSTNRNAIALAVTSYLTLIMPPEWAALGGGYVVAFLTGWYLLRTMAGRKRADGPIVTPSTVKLIGSVLGQDARGPGAALQALSPAPLPPPPDSSPTIAAPPSPRAKTRSGRAKASISKDARKRKRPADKKAAASRSRR